MTNSKKKWLIISLIIIVLIFFLFGALKVQNIVLKKIYVKDYEEYVYKYSEENNIDPFMTFAIIKVESKFNRNIKSSSGALGLMQLMESTAVEMANQLGEEVIVKESLYNPETNIKIGTTYYATLLKHYEGNKQLALAAYNAGMGNVDNWIKEGTLEKDGSNIENIPYKETNNYVRKIIRDYKIYKSIYEK